MCYHTQIFYLHSYRELSSLYFQGKFFLYPSGILTWFSNEQAWGLSQLQDPSDNVIYL